LGHFLLVALTQNDAKDQADLRWATGSLVHPACDDRAAWTLRKEITAHAEVEVAIATFLKFICIMDLTPLLPVPPSTIRPGVQKALRQIKDIPQLIACNGEHL
jgi:hypothetical protein